MYYFIQAKIILLVHYSIGHYYYNCIIAYYFRIIKDKTLYLENDSEGSSVKYNFPISIYLIFYYS